MRNKKKSLIFGTYVKRLREKYGISMEGLGDGLFIRQELIRMEKGDWEPDFFLREAILGRLGIEGETYEHFLNDVEACQFDKRMEILENVLWRRTDRAEELLEEYRQVYGAGEKRTEKISAEKAIVEKRLAMQFYLGILGQVRQETASRKELFDIFDQALRLTVPEAWERSLSKLVLSVNELNLMLEAERSRKGGARPEYLLDLMEYIEKRSFDGRGKAKVYPKAVCFYLRCQEERREAAGQGTVVHISAEKTDMDMDERLLEYCERGIELLRDNGRMYYLWELLDIRGRILERKLERLNRQESWMAADVEASLEENQKWKDVLEQVYGTWKVSRETLDNCYIYMPKAVSCINEVIRIRRRMLGLSRQELCRDICSRDTILRLEQHKSAGQREILRRLFRRLGLSGEFARPELETDNVEAMELLERLRERIHKCYWDDAEKLCLRLQGMVDMEAPCNRQVILNISAVIRWKRKEINNEEYCRLQREALEITMPYEAFLGEGEKYLMHQEQICIQNMMQGMNRESGEFKDCMRAFEELYKPCMEKGVTAMADGMYALIMGMVKSEYGNIGEYDKADFYNEPIIQGYLRLRKLWDIPHALYARWWNYAEKRKRNIPDDRALDDAEEVTTCLILSELAKDRSKVLFCQSVLSQMTEKKMI